MANGWPRGSSVSEFLRRVRASDARGADLTGRPTLSGITPIGGRAFLPPQFLPSDTLDDARADINDRTEPVRSARIARFLQPPRIVQTARIIGSLRTVSYGGRRDVPDTVQFAAGSVDGAGVVRVLYVEARVDGAAATTASHELKSVPISVGTTELGRATDPAITLLSEAREGGPVQFIGFASTQVPDGLGGTRPLMLGSARALGRRDRVDHLIVEHDAVAGTPSFSWVRGTPAPGRYYHVAPGIGFGLTPLGPRLMATFAAEDPVTGQGVLVAGRMVADEDGWQFVETSRAPVPLGPRDPADALARIWFNITVAYQAFLAQWIVGTTTGTIWEGRINVFDLEGRFFVAPGESVPRPTIWWPPAPEDPHSWTDAIVHPRTGTVALKSAHNTVAGAVSMGQAWMNQWDGIEPPDGVNPPETFPEERGGILFGARGGRWTLAACSREPWEFMWTAAGGGCQVVEQRVANLPARVTVVGRLFPGLARERGVSTGCHAIARVVPVAVTAHLGVWPVAGFGATVFGLAFVEDRFRG